MANQSPWDDFTVFFSASYSQAFLKKCYASRQKGSDAKYYDNCYPFIYYIEHAQNYYEQAKTAPLTIKPGLLFYGFGQLIKACLLTVDSSYPESTSVLAHGVSARKRKKQQYEFLYDEIKVQKNGLLTHFAEKMFDMNQLEGEKIIMKELLRGVPELDPLFFAFFQESNYAALTQNEDLYKVSSGILDSYHMPAVRFQEFLSQKTGFLIEAVEEKDELSLTFPGDFKLMHQGAFRLHTAAGSIVLAVNKDAKSFTLPEILIHYLLLYNLSMIARYETEWWLELTKTTPNSDFAFIKRFLHITETKGPALIQNWLREAHAHYC
ncbi:YaaC family protein [Peribacillus sp. SCS-37]|uniref:YaaC family protein n=1 Tax=Paraperibacillus esterisolvens TaxID=3115296 RepID=UPI00390611C9